MTRTSAALAVLLSVTLASESFAVGASGLTTQLVGAKAMGQANAFVAESDDPSAIYYNPAGITQLSGTQISVGAALVLPFVKRTGNGVPDDQMKEQLDTIPMFYATHSMELPDDRRLSYGVGLHSPFGLTTEWAPTSSLRYVATTSKFNLVDVNPTVALRICPQLSVGVGADYFNLLTVETDNKINQSFVGGADGNSSLSGHGQGLGYNAGILYQPVEAHSFGVSYRSQVQVPIKGSIDLTHLDPLVQTMFGFNGASYSADATSSVILPESVIAGYAFRPTHQWTLVADYEWTRWSVFNRQDVAIHETDPNRLAFLTGNGSNVISTDRNWRNVSAVGFGANYKLDEAWQFRGGYGYFQRTTPTETFLPDIPDSAIHMLALGFTRSWERFIVNVAFNGFFYADRNVSNTVGSNVGASVNGTYINVTPGIGIDVTYKIGS